MDEFYNIAHYFAPLCAEEKGAENLQNDAASLDVPADQKLVITTDSAICGWHVPQDATGAQLAQKLVRRNLSDLAAMGARPWRYTLNLNIPKSTDEAFVADFSQSLAMLQQAYGMMLIGGDSTFYGEQITASLTLLGLAQQTHSRCGAKIGDDIYVSGVIGDAKLGLMLLQNDINIATQHHANLLKKYYQPEPKLALGMALHKIASAVIDISDGLINDITHLAEASGVSIMLHRNKIPLSDMAQSLVKQTPALFDAFICAGDDYELAFSAPKTSAKKLQILAKDHAIALHKIGEVCALSDARVQLI
jgi:thiamine-monophosphate kinase